MESKIVLVIILICLSIFAPILYFSNEQDKIEKAKCDAVGGLLIKARSPLYACVKPMIPAK